MEENQKNQRRRPNQPLISRAIFVLLVNAKPLLKVKEMSHQEEEKGTPLQEDMGLKKGLEHLISLNLGEVKKRYLI